MSWSEFLIIYGLCLVAIVLCRCVPIFALKGRDLPRNVQTALFLIPPAAFAALVANDLLSPTMFDAGVWQGVMPLLSAAVVVVVAWKTRSLIWCALAGVAVYAILTLL